MVIIINLTSVFKGGAEQVALSFIEECKKIEVHTYHIFLRDNISSQITVDSFDSKKFRFYFFKERPGQGIYAYLKLRRAFSKFEEEIQPDCIVSTSGHGYWRSRSPLIVGYNIPHYVYSDSPFFSKITRFGRMRWKLKEVIHMYFYRRVDALFVQTEDVRKRLTAELLSSIPVEVISNTVNSCFFSPQSTPSKLPERAEGEVRLLLLSAYYAHKNIEIINPVLDELEGQGYYNFRFVVTLNEDKYKELFEQRRYSVLNVGKVPIAECPSLYQECNFMFLPSLLECFSASYAEAMLMGKPILTSDLGFARTVCQEAAVYFDPTSPRGIAEKIIQLHQDKFLQNQLIAKGKQVIDRIGTPDKRAKEILTFSEEVVKNRHA